MQRVQKLLSNYGYCSRRRAEELIMEGRVKVNNKLIKIGDKAAEQDNIFVDDKIINKEKKVYLMFNKPVKCVTAYKDKSHKTVMDYIKIKERVFPIGRLDYYTSGLLLLTNDGDFANSIMHPRYEIKKTYEVAVDKSITKESIKVIEDGVTLDDGKTGKADVNLVNDNIMKIAIHEGKNRIIRRMMKKLGYRIKTLERISIGKLGLGDLRHGKYKSITNSDKIKIFLK